MPALRQVKALVAAVAAQAAAAGASNVCAAGSLPYFECDFDPSSDSSKACMPGVNTGEMSPHNSKCEAPSPQNECQMYFDEDHKAWMWQSQKHGVECCNCFLRRPVGGCPPGSLPFFKCNFRTTYDTDSCYPGVNTGELAVPAGAGGECEVPSKDNGCKMEFDEEHKAWMFKSDSVTCCNCFQVTKAALEAGLSLAQAKAHSAPGALRRGGRAGLRASRSGEDGDHTSMLQVPLSDAEGEEYEGEEQAAAEAAEAEL